MRLREQQRVLRHSEKKKRDKKQNKKQAKVRPIVLKPTLVSVGGGAIKSSKISFH